MTERYLHMKDSHRDNHDNEIGKKKTKNELLLNKQSMSIFDVHVFVDFSRR